MRLSEFFWLHEFVRTTVDLPNEPELWQIQNMQLLCRRVLDPWREKVGRLYVTSGFRTAPVNEALKARGYRASRRSQHLLGQAGDERPLDQDIGRAWQTLCKLTADGLPVDQAILYVRAPLKGWIHVSHSDARSNRRELLVEPSHGAKLIPWPEYAGRALVALAP